MEYILTVQGLSKSYKQTLALSDVTMRIPKGAIYGLVGRNGAGKTTLLRQLCGLQEPDSGSYSLFGLDRTHKKIGTVRQRMGAVVETPSFYPELTARENLKQQCLALGQPGFADLSALLRTVGLSDTGKKKAGSFSFGMKQRLGIAMALVNSPDLLILDEPVNGLDPQGIIEIRELLLRLNRDQQVTVLISSHILDELSRVATHYGFLDRGRIVREISGEDLNRELRRSLYLTVTDTAALAAVLEEMGLEYRILDNQTAQVWGELSLSQLVLSLAAKNCEVLTSREHRESLESYFLKMVGGEDCD